MSNFAKTEDGRVAILGMQALKRIGQPADVGPVIAFLASDEARWITGDTIHTIERIVDANGSPPEKLNCCD
jgi:3-oxoacyl-[acyl-carrier protein] reductase